MAIGADYGIGPGTNQNRRLTEVPPRQLLDDSTHRQVQAFVNHRINSGALPNPA